MRIVEGRLHVGPDPPDGVPAYESVPALVNELEDASEAGTAVQAFDARYVAGREHLETAVAHANRSVERGENVADDRSVEILCYAAGRRQIDRALAMGVGEGTTPVLVVADGPAEDRVADRVGTLVASVATLEEGEPDRIREFFDVTPAEQDATDAPLADLVCERVALLDVEK
ncbi:MAG: KEOPS complex subunit Cgi121 [Halanaeroarchaeum sp.]